MKPTKADYAAKLSLLEVQVQDLVLALESIAANEKLPPYDRGDSGRIAREALARYYLRPMIRPRDG